MERWLSDPGFVRLFSEPWDWGVHSLKLRFLFAKVLDPGNWNSRHTKFGKPMLDRYVPLGEGGYRMRVSVLRDFCYVEFNPGRVFDDTEWRPAPPAIVRLALEYVIEALLPIVKTDVAPDDWEVQRIDVARDVVTPSGLVPVLPRPPRSHRCVEYDASNGASTGLQFQTHTERRRGVVGRFYDKHREAGRMQDVPKGTWRCEFSFDRHSANRSGIVTMRDVTNEHIRTLFAEYFTHCGWDRPYPSEPAYAALLADPRFLDPLIKVILRRIEADGGDVGEASVLRLRREILRDDWSIPRFKVDLQKGTVVRVIRRRKFCVDPDCFRRRYGRQRLCEPHYRQRRRALKRLGAAAHRPQRRNPPTNRSTTKSSTSRKVSDHG
jgi:hypothetical protein